MNVCGEDASSRLVPHANVDDTTTSTTSATQSTTHQGSFPPPGVSCGAGAGAAPPPAPLRCHVDNNPDTTAHSGQQQSGNIRQYLNIDTKPAQEQQKIAKTRDPSPPPLPSSPPPPSPYYRWTPGPETQHCRSPVPSWHCPVCLQQFSNVDTLSTHFHQFHLNPHHLSPDDRRKYQLSNFLAECIYIQVVINSCKIKCV